MAKPFALILWFFLPGPELAALPLATALPQYWAIQRLTIQLRQWF
jgi:hypothetical protein